MNCKYCNKSVYWDTNEIGVKQLHNSDGSLHRCKARTTATYPFTRKIQTSAVITIPKAPVKRTVTHGSKTKRKSKRYFNMYTVLNFGMHKGMTIEEVLKENRGYVEWMVRTFDDIFSDDVIAAANE